MINQGTRKPGKLGTDGSQCTCCVKLQQQHCEEDSIHLQEQGLLLLRRFERSIHKSKPNAMMHLSGTVRCTEHFHGCDRLIICAELIDTTMAFINSSWEVSSGGNSCSATVMQSQSGY